MGLIVRHLKGLAEFRGREGRAELWPWAGLVVVLTFVAISAAMSMMLSLTLDPRTESAASSLAAVNAVLIAMAVVVLGAVVLLAAAVARRLHDTGRRGWWGLPPAILLCTGLIGMRQVMSAFNSPSVSEEALAPMFGVMMVNNVLYIASLGLLIVLLALPSRSRPA